MKNIFIIHTHDSGKLFSPYGIAVPTPNIMEFARDSITFRNCHTVSPTCSPSRGALMTGRLPHKNGLIGLAHRGFTLNSTEVHLASFLKNHGFFSVLCGIQHEAVDCNSLGYQAVLGELTYDMGSPYNDMTAFDYMNANSLASFLNSYDKEKPLFVSMGFYNTHRVFPTDYISIDPNYLSLPNNIFDNEANRKDMAGFQQSVKIVDDCFGIVIDAIKRNGFYDNSIIIFTTDHGPAFPRMKCTLFDGGTGVALIIHDEEIKDGIKICDDLISNIDIFPTICNLLSITPPNELDGISFITNNRVNSHRTEIYGEINYHASYQPQRSIRTERYKYIKDFNPNRNQILSNIDECPEKKFLIENGIREINTDTEELYDLFFDPNEQNNLANDLRYRNIVIDLNQKLIQWMKITDDPLIVEHKVPRPINSLVNKQTCEDPGIPDWE